MELEIWIRDNHEDAVNDEKVLEYVNIFSLLAFACDTRVQLEETFASRSAGIIKTIRVNVQLFIVLKIKEFLKLQKLPFIYQDSSLSGSDHRMLF